MAKNAKRREWTKDDVRELKTLARQKTPVAKIAKSLKRTPGAIGIYTRRVIRPARLASLRSSCPPRRVDRQDLIIRG